MDEEINNIIKNAIMKSKVTKQPSQLKDTLQYKNKELYRLLPVS
jgi:hypothetical protein